MEKDFSFASATGQGDIRVRVWQPEDKPRAVLQITHGMAEHIDRYDDFAQYLAHNGVLVAGQDIAGHGKSIAPEGGIPGYFGEGDGWSANIADMRTLYNTIKAEYPDAPYILMGHSMGSFLARTYASRHGEDMDAFIFSGTAGKNPAVPIAKLIAKSEIKKHGGTTPSETLNGLSFGAYNNAFKPNRTGFDWLSRDAENVDKYVADPLCGFVFTAKAFSDLFNGLTEIQQSDWASKVPDRPILLISGTDDPVGGKNASGVRQVADKLIRTGHTVELNLYEQARHELLNETIKEQVYADLLDFINRQAV